MRPSATGRRRRLISVGASALLLAIPAAAVALAARHSSSPTVATDAARLSARRSSTVNHRTAPRGCEQLFTVEMAEGAANAIYSGHGKVSEHALKVLGYIERCQRNAAAQGFVRGYDRNQARMHAARVAAAAAQAALLRRYGGWAIPRYVVMCESSGRNAPPNSAGASGYYQIIPSTWAAYGGTKYAPSAYQATAQQQAVVASRIWDGGAGAGQWDCARG